MSPDYTNAAQAMQIYGGSFMKYIGAAWTHADATNRARLEAAFRAEFDQYNQFDHKEVA